MSRLQFTPAITQFVLDAAKYGIDLSSWESDWTGAALAMAGFDSERPVRSEARAPSSAPAPRAGRAPIGAAKVSSLPARNVGGAAHAVASFHAVGGPVVADLPAADARLSVGGPTRPAERTKGATASQGMAPGGRS